MPGQLRDTGIGEAIGTEAVEMVHCRRRSTAVPVTFMTSRGLFGMHTEVKHCPLREQCECDLSCLSAEGGRAFV